MPKKRFTNQYSKPPSTVHPSLNISGAASSSSAHNDAPATVNELITSLRRSHVSSVTPPTTIVTPTLPPQIRQLLSQPETPTPRPRDRRQRFDAAGRRLPAGPAPPQSWLVGSRHSTSQSRARGKERLYPHNVHALPGVEDQNGMGRRLQDMCLRTMARQWEFIREYESNNLADLPTRQRMLLLSHIAVSGPDEGVGSEGLNTVLTIPDGASIAQNVRDNNDGFYRVDLSGSVGRSLSFKRLIELVQKPATPPEKEDAVEISWEENLSRSINPPLPHLTHLSISHAPSTISWPRFLTLAKHIPTLTHLSLAFWPVPSLTPNAKTAVMASPYGKDIQYGGTNYYSHSLDDDYREAASIMKRLANHLYNLEYLDLEGCADWLQALRWTGDAGIDWSSQWVKMKNLVARCGYVLGQDSENWEVVKYTQDLESAVLLQRHLSRQAGKGRWIEVEKDDWDAYEDLWRDNSEESVRKRSLLDSVRRLKARSWKMEDAAFSGGAPTQDVDVERRSVWEQ